MEYKVFISSTHKDIEVARDVARRLEEAGVKVFSVDKTAVQEDNAAASVTRSLREADEVVVILKYAFSRSYPENRFIDIPPSPSYPRLAITQ